MKKGFKRARPVDSVLNRKTGRIFHKAFIIATLLSLIVLFAASAFAQNFLYQHYQYVYDRWHSIWTEPAPVESTVGGDAWMVNGKWVTGHFDRHGVWVRPGRRMSNEGPVPRHWYSPGYGTSWHQRHTHQPEFMGWDGCR